MPGITTKKTVLSGNEAIALAARAAGASVGCGYPGTPSTEILENFALLPGVYAEWSVNEKVAFEVGIGSSLAGARTLVTMKHVGLNVAADALFTSSYIGVKAGLVIVNADDPGMHSSQNEQDNRHYALAAKVPMLEPSDSQEAYDFTKLAFELSERYDTPVILRTTTRISHAKSVVDLPGEEPPQRIPSGFERNTAKYVMIPAYARLRHAEVEKRLAEMASACGSWNVNRLENGDGSHSLGFITAGICYQYVREAFPDAPLLKIGSINPLPEKMIRSFCETMDRVVVVEELDPFIESAVKAMGLKAEGKNLFPVTGEFDQDLVKAVLAGPSRSSPSASPPSIPSRPPTLCPGCPHRTVFSVLKKHDIVVTGDIGCYTLGVLPPFSSMDTCVEMGASVTMAQGIEIAERHGPRHKVASVIGDSTFAHSGISGLFNAAYNKRKGLIIVLDNGTTAMTGMQPNPFSGATIFGEPTSVIDYHKLGAAAGLSEGNVIVVNAYKPEDVERAILSLLDSGKLSLLVIKGPCVIAKSKGKIR
jgi:indolepyruvate ferredoxin oxidoreductase alpha subunit